MFFNSAGGFDLRESTVVRKLGNGESLRRALLVGTILGAGAVTITPAAAQSINDTYTTPQLSVGYSVSGSDTITLTNTSTGTITGTSDAILVGSVNGSIDIGDVAGLRGAVKSVSGKGIVAQASGAGGVTIKTVGGGTVEGWYDGIWAHVNGGSMTIDLGANVTGTSFSGIYAESVGAGAITVKSAANVAITGSVFYGIGAVGAGGAIDIGATAGLGGPVSAATGVYATNAGAGTINIKTASGGTVTGVAGGVVTNAVNGATTITLGAAVTGGALNREGGFSEGGVFAKATGSGAISILSTAAVSTLSNNAFGIAASSQGGAINIGGAAGLSGAVSGATGIYTKTTGAGSVTIKTASGGTVTGTGYYGLEAEAADGDITFDVGDVVRGRNRGVSAIISGSGNIFINSTARIAGVTTTIAGGVVSEGAASGYGIYAAAGAGAIDIGGTAGLSGAVSGGDGIYARGSGAITVKTAAGGTVTGTAGNGITTTSGTGATTITIGAAVNGVTGGVVTNAVDGATTITLGAAVTGGALGRNGNLSEGGVFASATGSGAVTILSTAAVSTLSDKAFGIGVLANGGAVKIGGEAGLSGAVSGSTGVFAKNEGAGAVTIKTVSGGAVTGTPWVGLEAYAVDGDITLDVGDVVRGGMYGVLAQTSGAGAIMINSTARIAGTTTIVDGVVSEGAASEYGISAKANSGAINIGGTAGLSGAVSGVKGGIFASGAGAVTIKTAAGGTVSTGGIGIETSAVNGATTIDLGAAVTSAGDAVKATASGTGTINITTAAGGAVTATGQANAITTSALNGATTISLGAAASGKVNGVSATATGAGAVTVTSTARVHGDSGTGLLASSKGGNVQVGTESARISGEASGGTVGIAATTEGIGTVAVRTGAGNVTTGFIGIRTAASAGATAIDIGSGSTVTAREAIQASTGAGNVIVTNAGAVSGGLRGTTSGTGTLTFNNSGTFWMGAAYSNTGFAIKNLSGGVLTGTGSFGSVAAASDSIIRVGDRTLGLVDGAPVMGTLNATSLTLASGAIVEIRANYTSGADTIAVTGAAALNGATLNITATPQVDATWVTGKSFTILTAGSVTGTFGATQLDYAFLKSTLAYTTTRVTLTLERNWTSFGACSTTPNQKSVSDVFDNFQSSGSNPLIAKVTTLTIPQAPVAMSQLSGTGVAAARTQSFGVGTVFTGAINSEMGKFTGSAGGGAALSYAPDKKITKAFDKVAAEPVEPILDGRVWMQVLGGVATMKSDATNPAERATNYGLAAGVDTAINANLRVGAALSGGQSSSKVASLATKADSTWGQGALYAVATDGDRYAKAALVYGYLTTETERTVTAFATPETAKGKFGANLFSTRLEVGQKFVTGGPVNLTPFAAFEPSWLVQDAYSETGAATIGLGYGKTTTRALPATLGMKCDGDVALDGMRVTPSATLGWVHNFASTSSMSPFFVALPGSTFTVAGAKGDRNLARTELNVEATPDASTATFYANARADLGARTNAVRGTAGMMMRF